jgi:VanZ family protein
LYHPSEAWNVRLRVPLVPRGLRWGLVALAAGVIGYQSLVVVPSGVPHPGFAPVDKWLHTVAYLGLTGTLAYALADAGGSRHRRAAAVFALAFATGLALELAQGLLPYRYFGLGDLLANALGASLALAWYLIEPRVEWWRVPAGE